MLCLWGLEKAKRAGWNVTLFFKPDGKEGAWDAGVSGRGKFQDEGGGGDRIVGYAGDGVWRRIADRTCDE